MAVYSIQHASTFLLREQPAGKTTMSQDQALGLSMRGNNSLVKESGIQHLSSLGDLDLLALDVRRQLTETSLVVFATSKPGLGTDAALDKLGVDESQVEHLGMLGTALCVEEADTLPPPSPPDLAGGIATCPAGKQQWEGECLPCQKGYWCSGGSGRSQDM